MRLLMALVLLLVVVGCTPSVRRAAYLDAHPELPALEAQRIAEGLIWRGMTDEQLRASWGAPWRTREHANMAGTCLVLEYGPRRSPTWVFVRGGHVTGWSAGR